MKEKSIPKSVKRVCEAVRQCGKKSLRRVKATSWEILLAASQSHSSEVLRSYEQYLKELESRKDPQEKKKE